MKVNKYKFDRDMTNVEEDFICNAITWLGYTKFWAI